MEKALKAQYPWAIDYVARRRRLQPEMSPAGLLKYSKKIYIGSVTATGAAAGAAAAVPNGAVQVPAAIVDLATFMEASVFYVPAAAEVHGLDLEDYERRRFLVMAALLGDSAMKSVVGPLTKRTAPHLGKEVVKMIPAKALLNANKVLGRNFITKYGTKQGILVLAEQIPFFIGAGIGAGGNAAFATMIARSTKAILGAPPAVWPEHTTASDLDAPI